MKTRWTTFHNYSMKPFRTVFFTNCLHGGDHGNLLQLIALNFFDQANVFGAHFETIEPQLVIRAHL